MIRVNDTHATYRLDDTITITQRSSCDGTWLAMFAGFVAYGATESDALVALATRIENIMKYLRREAAEVDRLRRGAAEVDRATTTESTEPTEPIAVVLRTYSTPKGDICGQIVNATTGEILHQCGWTLSRKEAWRDAEQLAQRNGYRVVDAL